MHSVVDRKLGNFQFPAFTNKMAMVMIEQISLWKDDVSTGNKPKCDIGRSPGISIPLFLTNHYTD